MPVEPIPCDDGGGGTPVEVTTCCSPSIASAPLCRADGTTVLAVVRSGCVECGETAADPTVVGWLDTAGAFTPGALPADVGPCEAGCVDTICRQLCDDTDGDGQADTTYSELWCIRPDGSAELVLTYRDDPSQPYTPLAPVECTYGCPESETLQLCDDAGPFLRRYTWLNGVATYEDSELDGATPHVVTGTVRACAGSGDCLTTVCRTRCDDTDGDGQADTTYSELWCIGADGSAEVVLTYQDDPATPYTPTAPVDCEYGAVASEALPLCDDSGPFLRHYTWTGGASSYEDTELDGATPHVVTGTVHLCPAAPDCEAPTTPAATLGLCLADGTPIAVLVTRDCEGTVTQDGWLNLTTGTYSAGDPPAGTMACGNPRSITTAGTFCDIDPVSGDVLGLVLIEYTYGADGAVAAVRLVDATTGQTYTPQGEVTTCPAGVEQPERDLVQLCDTAADGTVTEFVRDYARDENGAITGHTDYLLDGTPYTPTGTVSRCVDECHDCETVILCDTVATPPATIAGTAASGTLSNGVAYATTAPSPFAPGRQSDGAAWWGTALFPNPVVPLTRWTFDQPVNVDFSVAMVWSPATTLPGENTVQVPPGAVPLSLPAGYTFNQATGILRADSTLTGCTLNAPTREASARFRLTGVSTFTLQYLGSRVLSNECRRLGTWEFGALDVTLGGQFARTVCRDCTGAVTTSTDTLLDGTTPYTPVGLVGVCQPEAAEEEPCRDSSSTLLCDTAAQDAITVFDPANIAGSDGWQVVSYTTVIGNPPEAALPYDAPHPPGALMGARTDLSAGAGPAWSGYATAPHRWVLRKTFTAPEDGIASVSSVGFRGDGGARVRVNNIDAGMYGQWNQPATSGTAQIPVTAGPNTVEIEVRDGGGPNFVQGRLDIVMTRTVQFMRRTVVDCATGETVSVVDTTLDGEPYTVTGEVGQCEPVAECCEPPPPESRVDVETALLCVREQATGVILGQVIAERVYDDQTGDLAEQRLTDLDGAPYALPAGAELTQCPSPDRITRQVCVVESGSSEFLTNAANATSGQDTDWTWSPNLAGPWHPMYRVAPNPVWTAADTAPNAAHWVGPHSNRTVCPAAGETSPPVPGTWYTRASWNLPVDVSPDSIRIAATVLNADNKVVQWRLNDGAWQPVGGGTLAAPAWTFPPTAVPGGRAGQNDVVVQITETQPAVSCPSPNEAGMILHVIATYDHAPQVWTQVIEPGGHTYYLDENGDRQDSIPAGRRLVACGGGGDAPCCPPEARVDVETALLCVRDTASGDVLGQVLAERVYDDQSGDLTEQRLTDLDGDPYTLPAGAELTLCQEPDCPVAFSTECVGAVTRTEASYDNTSLIGGLPGQCGSVQGPGGQFPCQPGPFTITSWIVNGVEVIAEGGGRTFNGGACGPGTAGAPGMHLNWSQALTNLDPTGATWSAKSEPACAWFVGSTGGTETVYGPMTVQDTAGQQWILGPAQACVETQFTKVYTQQCDGSVTVSWLDAQGVETSAPVGDLVPCGTGCGAGGGQGLDVETLTLCDVQGDGTAVPFLRHFTYGSAGQVTVVLDTALDGFAPYTPTGTVGRCQAEGRDVEIVPMCVVDNGAGSVVQRILAEVTYDTATGERLGVNYVDPLTWGPVAMPGGTHLDLCPEAPAEDCRDSSTLLLCDATTTATEVAPTVVDDSLAGIADPTIPPSVIDVAPPYSSLWSGGTLAFPAEPDGSAGDGVQVYRAATGQITASPENCAGASGTLTVSLRVTLDGPGAGAGHDGTLRLYRGATLIGYDNVLPGAPAGHVETLTVSAPVTAEDLASGSLRALLWLETFHGVPKAWTADQFTVSAELDGCAVQFLRTITVDCDTGEPIATVDTTLAGDPYTVTGEVRQCATAGGGACCPPEPCRDTSTLLVCDLPTDGAPTPTVTDTSGAPYYPYSTGVPTAGAQALWDGGTLSLPDAAGPQPGTGGTVRTAAAVIQAPQPLCDTGTAHVTVQVDVTALGPDNGCANTGFLALYNGPGEASRVALALAPLNTPAGWAGTLTAEADVPAADLAAGNIAVLVAFDAYDDSGTACPPPRHTAWQLSQFAATVVYDQTGCATQFLRTVTTECETGAVLSVADSTLDGAPYTVTGEPGQCTPAGGGTVVPPCGDTEVAQLCDVTYDPQAPIPTPAGDFTLTGNVIAANDGTTLWFAQANQPADGVAELTVSGLLPATLYEFRFASAWIGAGAPDPANNNAIYLLEILDGTTVLATRTRNTSNGSNVFPGGVLTEDLPPLAFIAPATGAVTIRFTDQTTGGPVNDRDLFLMPFEVRTAVLTVNRTPFLRRFTFDCNGSLTSTEDVALDGVTPYVVQGEADQCTAEGSTAGTVMPCDAQNVIEACRCDDTDGDGLPDTGYVELLAVDCEGALTSLGTYTDGLTGPYTPVSPVDCNTVDEAEGAPPAFGVQARRVELTAGASWDAAAWPTLQSVTAVAHSGSGTVTTADGPSTLHAGESVTWSVARDADAGLTGPLTITAGTGTGTVTLSYTIGVTL